MDISRGELRKVQLLQLKNLLEVKRICEKYDLKYFLIGGTLIGAIRHKGFIPWDDDIDIGMLREDYDKFITIAQNELDEEFFLETSSSGVNHGSYCISRIRLNNTIYRRRWETNNASQAGIAIDVIAYDRIPDNYIEIVIYYYIFQLLTHVYMLRIGDYPSPRKRLYRIITKIASFFLFWLKTEKMHIILEHYHERYKNKEGKYRILLAGGWGLKERHLYTTITNLTTTVFEGITLPIPTDYHLFLTEQYGDYMTPPPKEKQIGRHFAMEFDLGPYKDIEKIEDNK